MKSDSLIDDIKARIDIVDLVAEHVDLKRAGQNFKGLCPFHTEKTPSFMVSPSKQIFHCFGCSKGGDIFAFVMHYENLAFQEALAHLARKAGIPAERLAGGAPSQTALKEGLFAINAEAAHFFREALAASPQALGYLKKRGLTGETIEHFSLGYCGSGRDALFVHLKKKGFSPEHIKASGLVYFGSNGTHDFFRERVMFPISDLQGRIVAFGGRTLSSSKSIPKYLNSPDSPVFKKGETCYALHHAKQTIAQKNYTIVVEGYLDAITCHHYGFQNAVAPLGTALTTGQVSKLKRLSHNLLLLFDGDAAGAAAAKRSLELVFAQGMTAKVLMLPAGEDPDTFLRTYGTERLRLAISKAVTPIEFLVKLHGKKRMEAVKYALSLLTVCPDALLRDETLRELSSWSGVHEQALREELQQGSRAAARRTAPLAPSGSGARSAAAQSSAPRTEEAILLNIALSIPGKAPIIVRKLNTGMMEDNLVRGIFEKMKPLVAESGRGPALTEALLALCSPEERELVTRHALAPSIDEEQVDRNIEDCFTRLTLRDVEARIKTADREGDLQRLHALGTERRNILRKLSGQSNA